MTTNLPTGDDMNLTPFFYCEEDGSTFRGLVWDYVDLLAPSDFMHPDGY